MGCDVSFDYNFGNAGLEGPCGCWSSHRADRELTAARLEEGICIATKLKGAVQAVMLGCQPSSK